MSTPSKYCILHQLGLGNCQGEEIIEAKEFLTQQVPGLATGEKVPEKEIISQLWRLYQSDSDEPLAEVCLRCIISHYLKDYCYTLAQQYGGKHNFKVHDLLPLVLDSTDSSLNHGNNNSLTVRILQTFDVDKRSSLSAWIKIVVRGNKELKIFLLEHGIEQITNWSLLKQYSLRQLQRILSEFYHYSPTEIQQLTQLLSSYHTVYLSQIQAARRQINQERKQQGLGKTKSPYPAPNSQQLQQMAEELVNTWKLSPDEVLQELQNLAQLIREYKSRRARGVVTQPLGRQETILPAPSEEEDNGINQFLSAFSQQYDSCFLRAVQEVIEDRVRFYRRKKKPKDQQFLQALHLYHCQVVPQGKIALQLGLQNQSQVSRLMEHRELHADVVRKTVNYLILEIFKIIPESPSLERQNELRIKLTPILNEKVAAEMQQAQKEDRASKNRIMENKLSQAICKYLDDAYK